VFEFYDYKYGKGYEADTLKIWENYHIQTCADQAVKKIKGKRFTKKLADDF